MTIFYQIDIRYTSCEQASFVRFLDKI